MRSHVFPPVQVSLDAPRMIELHRDAKMYEWR